MGNRETERQNVSETACVCECACMREKARV